MLPAEKRGFRTCKRPAAGGEGGWAQEKAHLRT